jgi:F-type H+-transporting ATPase subunit b
MIISIVERLQRDIRSHGRAAFVAFLFCFAALPALASGDGSHGPTVGQLVWQGVNLAILIAVLVFAARKPVGGFFADRREQIQSDIESAAELLGSAEKRVMDWQGKLSELQSELDEIREISRRRGEEEREHIIAAAHDTADRIKSEAVAMVDQELRRARSELQDEAANLAVDLAAEILREQVSEGDRERLADEFITRVEPGSAPAGNGR